MSVSGTLQKAWDNAENELVKNNNPNGALEILRSVAWDSSENAVQRAKTLSLAANIYVVKADTEVASRKANLKRAYKNYSNALKLDPKSKETLRERGKLTSVMDQEGISIGQSFQVMDNGSPTPLGLLVGLVAILLVLSSVKVLDDFMDESASESQATMQISYVPNGMTESDRTTANIVIDLYPAEAPHHVENFIDHSNSGNYDATVFHRIIDNFISLFTPNDIKKAGPFYINGNMNGPKPDDPKMFNLYNDRYWVMKSKDFSDIFVLISSAMDNMMQLDVWANIYERIQAYSKYKHKDHPGLSSRTIFKYMDIVDLVKKHPK